jgi:hypothetical protein
MNCSTLKKVAFAAGLIAASVVPAQAGIFITEVNPAGSGAGHGYTADWFEVTNTGASSVNISGWKMDDNSNSFAASVALRGVTSIGAGQSVVFFEGVADGSTDAAILTAFNAAWGTSFVFGTSIGAYGGSGVGLGQGGDAVNLFDGGGALQAHVDFGAATSNVTFDNAANLNNATIAQLSVVGVNGAYLSANGVEIGSPGLVAAPVPEPETYAMLLAGLGLLGFVSRRRKQKHTVAA